MIKKNLPIVLCMLLAVVFFLTLVRFETVDEHYRDRSLQTGLNVGTVTLTIRCDTVLEDEERLRNLKETGVPIPEDGVILEQTSYKLQEGESVFDLLQRAVRENRIQLEFQGADMNGYGSAYIQGIHYLYEFACGELSGWTYTVNGEFPGYGCSQYMLKDGDEVAWLYTCDLGHDLEMPADMSCH